MTSVARVDPLASRTITWWPVHQVVSQMAEKHGFDIVGDPLPYPGTLAWLQLPEEHPARVAALLRAADYAVLRLETEQVMRAEASKAIARSTDWSQISHSLVKGRGGAYVPRAS